MNEPAILNKIPAMTAAALDSVRAFETRLLAMPQSSIATHHVLHAGMYARTIRIPAGTIISGVEIRVATMLIFNGHASVFIGDRTIEICGYQVIPASAGRKQVIAAHADTDLTMLFQTSASTVEEAEEQFTNEASRLASRSSESVNEIIITKE